MSLWKNDPRVFVVVLLPPSLHKEKNRFLTDIIIQVLLRKDQVEVSPTDLTADYTDSVLLHRSVVEDLNRTIRVSLYHQIHKQSQCKTWLLENKDVHSHDGSIYHYVTKVAEL